MEQATSNGAYEYDGVMQRDSVGSVALSRSAEALTQKREKRHHENHDNKLALTLVGPPEQTEHDNNHKRVVNTSRRTTIRLASGDSATTAAISASVAAVVGE